jgi:hypothetical protein
VKDGGVGSLLNVNAFRFVFIRSSILISAEAAFFANSLIFYIDELRAEAINSLAATAALPGLIALRYGRFTLVSVVALPGIYS